MGNAQAAGEGRDPPAPKVSVPAELFGHWVHSHEEDGADAEIYRPRGWPLPPARGRTAFEIKPDGEFVEYVPGPVDVSASRTGRWQAVAPDCIAISLPGQKTYELRISSVGSELLKVKRG
jgi:hypothetical protein